MAGEGDETKWVGIRPTNPAEIIPVGEVSPVTSMDVTEQVPLTQIKVEPLAAGTEFKTLTEKRSPAIADLGAIKGQWIEGQSWSQSGAADVTKSSSVVPAGEIWICKLIATSQLSGTTSHIYHILDQGADDFYLNGVLAPTARNFLFTKSDIILVEDDYIKVVFGSLSNGAYTTWTVAGIKIGLY